MIEALPHGIGCSLEPLLRGGGLRCSKHLYKTARVVATDVGVVCLGKMTVERRGVELRKAVDFVNARVNAVGHGNVNQTVVGTQRDSRFRALLGERIETATSTTTENNTQYSLQN